MTEEEFRAKFEDWTKRAYEAMCNRPESMTEDQWLEGFWGPHVTKTWRDGQKFWGEFRRHRSIAEQDQPAREYTDTISLKRRRRP
jgi:hypothetical protein